MDPRPTPSITASVCNYNGGEDVLACVAALRRQTLALRRIVVYDNGSSDGSLERLRAEHPAVEVVAMAENRGPCPARNRALAECADEWMLQVDHDVILDDDCLERVWREVEHDPDAAVWMPRAVFDHEPERVHYDGGAFHYVGILALRNFFRVPAADEPTDACDVDAVIATALLMRRDAVRAVGGYDEGYFILFEDHDLSFRLRAAGHRLRLVRAARCRHRTGTVGISYREGPRYPERRAFLHARNRWRLLLRCHSTRALVLGLPGILIYDAVYFVFALTQGHAKAWWRGKREALAQRGELRAEHRRWAATRRLDDGELLRAPALTHAPMVRRSRFARLAEHALSGSLRVWWALVGWML